ncbi:hypothetical protein vseg_016064 [Gypsophila vaccaria]
MPGTIQVSILEVVGLPHPQQSSSMGITVSMGKQAYDMEEKGNFSFVLASLRDNLRVTVHDSEGNEIAHTGVQSRLIVEKGMWDDVFPLQGGGHVHMKLHFILTEEEQKRIRSMRESAARKKREDLLKRTHSSSDLAVASGGSSAPRGDSLKTPQQSQEGIFNRASRQPENTAPGPSAIVPSHVHPVQKKQVFSSSKSTGALDKLPGYQRVKKEIRYQNEEQQSRLDKPPSNVKNMVLAFESSPVKVASPATSKTRTTPPVSSIAATDLPLKAPKKTVAVSAKLAMSKLQTVSAPLSEEKVKEREEITTDTPLKSSKEMVSVTAKPVSFNVETSPTPISKTTTTEKEEIEDYVDSCQETSCSTTVIDTPMRMPNKAVSVTAKPVSPNFETLPAPISKPPMTEKEEVGDFVDSRQEASCSTTVINTPMRMPNKSVSVTTKPVLTNSETAHVPMLGETVAEVKVGVHSDNVDACWETSVQNTEEFKEFGTNSVEQTLDKNISQLVPPSAVSREELISENKLHSRLIGFGQSKFSSKTLSRGLPRRIAEKSLMRRQIATSFDSSVFKKNRKSKHLKSSKYMFNMKPKVSCGNKYDSSGGFRGWIFLEETIHPCVQNDDRLLIDQLEGGYSNCCPDATREKLKDRDDDTDVVPNNDEKTCVESRALVSSERADSRPHINPVRQVVNIAIMVGFGILVLLTRQRK